MRCQKISIPAAGITSNKDIVLYLFFYNLPLSVYVSLAIDLQLSVQLSRCSSCVLQEVSAKKLMPVVSATSL